MDHPALEYFVTKAFTLLWGITPGTGVYTPYNNDNDSRRDWLSSIWFQTHKARGDLYSLPAANVGLKVSSWGTDRFSMPTRRLVNLVDGTFSNAHQLDHYIIDRYVICQIPLTQKIAPDGGGSWEHAGGFSWRDPITGGRSFHEIQDNQGLSSVIIYGLTNGNDRALYIKPFGGCDTFCVPAFDRNLYDLELIFERPFRRAQFSRRVNVNLDSYLYSGGSGYYDYRIPKTELMWYADTNLRRMRRDVTVKLYLRRKSSDQVSPLSTYYVRGKANPMGLRMSDTIMLVESERVTQ
jgi:hypothetical protein